VDEATQDVAPADRTDDSRDAGRSGRVQLECAVGPCLVVVADVLCEHAIQVFSGDNEEMV